jgi:hypothetical protein
VKTGQPILNNCLSNDAFSCGDMMHKTCTFHWVVIPYRSPPFVDRKQGVSVEANNFKTTQPIWVICSTYNIASRLNFGDHGENSSYRFASRGAFDKKFY